MNIFHDIYGYIFIFHIIMVYNFKIIIEFFSFFNLLFKIIIGDMWNIIIYNDFKQLCFRDLIDITLANFPLL
ncbi:MAG: hypothetical protein EBV77_08670 [Gemmatimonadaceae bacterium]|nr:hypothetical protein [Gemmatimonadaceae bacterium]